MYIDLFLLLFFNSLLPVCVESKFAYEGKTKKKYPKKVEQRERISILAEHRLKKKRNYKESFIYIFLFVSTARIHQTKRDEKKVHYVLLSLTQGWEDRQQVEAGRGLTQEEKLR